MHLATTEAIRRAAHGQALALAVSYSLRYDKHSSQLTPTQNLGLWKSIVLPHFLQNLRYIHSESDIKKMQTSLNLSLARVLHVYGDHTALLADTGIPPLQLTRYVHLAQLHFRLTTTRPDTLPALLFQKLNTPLSLLSLHPTTLDYHIRYASHAFNIDLSTDPFPHMASQPPKNRERAFRNMMRKIISDLWKGQLYNAANITKKYVITPGGHLIGRQTTYTYIAKEDLQRLDLFKPAQYLRTTHNQLPLLRLRTQATSYIPSHSHLTNNHTYIPYHERYCPFCLPRQIIANETHVLLHCPHFSPHAQPAIQTLTAQLRRFDLWTWTTYTDIQKVGMLLGSIPPRLDRQHEKAWVLATAPMSTQLIYSIQSHSQPPQPCTIPPPSLPAPTSPFAPPDDAHCQVCQSPFDEYQMLLCDTCNAGWHMDCLLPPLTTIPPGTWQCPLCTPPHPLSQAATRHLRLPSPILDPDSD